MNPLLGIALTVLALGALLLGVESGGPRLRTLGPWLIVAVAALCVGLGAWLSHEGHSTWQQLVQPRPLESIAHAACFLALFASEAVLMGRWLLRAASNPWLSLATFTLGTFLAWLITFLALVAVVPGS